MFFTDKHYRKSGLLAAMLAASFLTACGDGGQQAEKKAGEGGAATQAQKVPPMLTAQVNLSPLFESAQGWSAGYAKARSKGEGRGVVVGPGSADPTVFAQQFPAKPDEPFKVIARASSVGKPKAMARIQINWLGAEYKFITAFVQPFEVTPEETTFEVNVTAPAGAIAGTLYVVPGAKEDVVRYIEMRVLGQAKE